MSTKFFSLISGIPVHLGKKSKVIPAQDFSELVSSKELLKKVQEEAAEYKQNVIEECETLKEAAQKEGFEAGFQQWVAHIAKLEEEIKNVHNEVEKLVIPVALRAAKKIVETEISASDDLINNIVNSALKAVSQHKKITIFVNKKDLAPLEANKNNIRSIFESLESLTIRDRDDIEPGGCVIETEAGIINYQLKDRWRTLEAALEEMATALQRSS